MGLKQLEKPVVERVTLTDGSGLYANALVTFDQTTEPSIARAILASPKWYVIKMEQRNVVQN